MTDYAALAQSLKDNEAFQAALDNIRSSALEALATLSHGDTGRFYWNQATVKVVDEIRADLDQFIRAGKPRGAPGIA